MCHRGGSDGRRHVSSSTGGLSGRLVGDMKHGFGLGGCALRPPSRGGNLSRGNPGSWDREKKGGGGEGEGGRGVGLEHNNCAESIQAIPSSKNKSLIAWSRASSTRLAGSSLDPARSRASSSNPQVPRSRTLQKPLEHNERLTAGCAAEPALLPSTVTPYTKIPASAEERGPREPGPDPRR
jgi:hypothetical protein